MGAAGVDALRRHLEDPDGTSPHTVTAPAEDDGVDPHGKDPLQQHLSLTLVEQEAKDEVHEPDDCIGIAPTKRRNRG
jgi:hypothetical protein